MTGRAIPTRNTGCDRSDLATVSEETAEPRVGMGADVLTSIDAGASATRTRRPARHRRVTLAAFLAAGLAVASGCGTSDRERAQELCTSIALTDMEISGGEPMTVDEVVAELEGRDATSADYWRGLDPDLFVARCEVVDAAGRVGEVAINERGDNVLLVEPRRVPTSAPGNGY